MMLEEEHRSAEFIICYYRLLHIPDNKVEKTLFKAKLDGWQFDEKEVRKIREEHIVLRKIIFG